MMIEMNSTVGTVDIPNEITSSEGTTISVGQTTTITYRGVSPKIMAEGTAMSEITLWLDGELLDSARTCSRVRGAYLDSTHTFTANEPGTYVFALRGGYKYMPWEELDPVAELILRVV